MNELLHKFKLGNDAELLLEKPGGGYEKVATVPIGSQALGVTQSAQGVGNGNGAGSYQGAKSTAFSSPVPASLAGLLTGDCRRQGLSVAATALNVNACKVAFWGDSITENADCPDFTNRTLLGNYRYVVQAALQRAFPACTFAFGNFGLGSRSGTRAADSSYVGMAAPENTATGFLRAAPWGDGTGSTVGKAWRDHVKDFAPNLLVVAFGMNAESEAACYAHINSIKTYIATWTPVPSIVLVPVFRPNPRYDPNQHKYQTMARVYREFARLNGYSYMDVGRLHNLLRDGFDEVNPYYGSIVDDFSGAFVSEGAGTLSGGVYTMAVDSFVRFPVNAYNLQAECQFIYPAGVATTGRPYIRFRRDLVGPNQPQYGWAYYTGGSLQLWDGAAQVGSSGGLTNTGNHKFRVNVSGSRMEFYVDDVLKCSGNGFPNMRNGVVEFGYVAAGATVGGGQISNPRILWDEPSKLIPSYTDDDLLGTFVAGDFSTRRPYGGNGANHPSTIGVAAMYRPAVDELIRALQDATT